MGLAAAIAVPAVIGVGGAIASSSISGKAAESAASTQAQAADQATALQEAMFNQTQQNIQPWLTGGGNSLNALQQALGLVPGGAGGINATNFQGSPGYQWQLGQGTNAILNNASATGGISGNTLKALQTYGTGLANQDWYNYLNQLMSLSGQGANAASNLGATAANVSGNISNTIQGAGNARAAGTIGSANALTGGISGATSGVNNGLNNLVALSFLSQLNGGGPNYGSNPATLPTNLIT